MKNLFKRYKKTETNLATSFARARFAQTMPGESAALASLRLGGMSL